MNERTRLRIDVAVWLAINLLASVAIGAAIGWLALRAGCY